MLAARKKSFNGWTLPSWWSCSTSSKRGSGFQMPGVCALCGTCGQNIVLSVQSGWLPFAT